MRGLSRFWSVHASMALASRLVSESRKRGVTAASSSSHNASGTDS
jgi:hypothetical protein